jgi:hypothetical protein
MDDLIGVIGSEQLVHRIQKLTPSLMHKRNLAREGVESGENSTTEFPTLSTALGNPAQDAGFPPFHSAAGEVSLKETEEENMKPKQNST